MTHHSPTSPGAPGTPGPPGRYDTLTRIAYTAVLDGFWGATGHQQRAAVLRDGHRQILAHAATPAGRLDFEIFAASLRAAHAAVPLSGDRDARGRAEVEATLLLLEVSADAA